MARASQNYYPDGEYLDKRNRVFGLKDEILQKLDSIPEVVDNLTSTSTTAALSANMGRRLNQRINSIEGGTRFLSLWDCAQGQPISFPEHVPYAYETGDNYLVSNVSDGGTNFRPDGDAFSGQQSGVEETETVKPGDVYVYDGTNWLLQSNTPVVVDPANVKTFTLSGQDLNTAQEIYDFFREGKTPIIEYNDKRYIVARHVVYANALYLYFIETDTAFTGNYYTGFDLSFNAIKFDINRQTYDVRSIDYNTKMPMTYSLPGGGSSSHSVIRVGSKVYDEAVYGHLFTTSVSKQDKFIIGNNLVLEKVCTVESDMKGPCSSGFHVRSNSEASNVENMLNTLGASFSDLKMPGAYWLSNVINSHQEGYSIRFNHVTSSRLSQMFHVRPAKNTPVIPDNTWDVIIDGSSIATGAGIFWNQTDGLISISDDGVNRITLSDKNIGATTVWNTGDQETQENSGGVFLQGNNYMFPITGATKTSADRLSFISGSFGLDEYGPGNYYYSDIGYSGDGNVSRRNWGGDNLRGGVSQGTYVECNYVLSAQVPDSAQWGNITGNLIDQIDLQSTLNLKEDKVNKTNQIYAPGVMPDYEESGLLIFSPDGMHVSEVDGTTVKTYSLSTANDFAGQKILISTLTAPGNAFTGYLTDAGDRLILLGNTWRIAYGVYLDNGGTPFAFSDQATEVTYDDRINGTQPTYFKSTTNLYDYSDFENRNAEFVGMVLKENGGSEWGIRYIKYNDNNQCCKAEIGYYEWNNPSRGAYTWNIFDQLSNLDSISRIIYVGNGEYDGTCLVYGSYNGGSPKRYRTTSGWTNRYEPHDAYVDLNIQYNGTNILGTYHTNVKNIGNKNRFLSSDRYLGYKAIENGLLTKYNIVKDYGYRQDGNDNRVASQRTVEWLSETKQNRIDYTVENQANKIKDFTYAYNREKDFYNKEINGQQVAISGPHYVVYSDDGYHAGLICTDRNSGYHSYIGQIQTQRSFDYETDLPNMIEIDFNQFNFGNVNTRYVILGNDGLHLILRDRDCTHPLVVTTSVPWDFTPSNCTFEIQQPRDPNDTQQGNVGYTADGLRIYTQDKNIYQTDTPFNFNQSHLTLIQNFTEIYSDRWTDQNAIKWSPDGKHFNLSGYRASPQSGYSRWSSYMYKTDTPYIINNIQLVVNYGYLDYDDMYLGTPTPIGCTRTNGPAYWQNPITYFYIYADPEDIVSYPSMKALNEYVKANAGGQVDWNQTDITAKDYIKNKPTEIGNVSNNRGTVTSGNIAVFDGTTGKLIRDKGLSIVNTDTAPAGLGASQIYYDHGHIYIVSPSYQVQLENDDILLLENDDILLF